MSRRAIAIACALCLLGGITLWTIERQSRKFRVPTYHCQVPDDFNDLDRRNFGLSKKYGLYLSNHRQGWKKAYIEWRGRTNLNASIPEIPADELAERAFMDGWQQFHREKQPLITLPNLSH